MNAQLKILEPAPFCYCMPWRLRGVPFVEQGTEEAYHGARCCHCDREVAAPEVARGKHVACIYCGMDRGVIGQEVPPWLELACTLSSQD